MSKIPTRQSLSHEFERIRQRSEKKTLESIQPNKHNSHDEIGDGALVEELEMLCAGGQREKETYKAKNRRMGVA